MDSLFYEMEYESASLSPPSSVAGGIAMPPIARPIIAMEADETRKRFTRMRDIARTRREMTRHVYYGYSRFPDRRAQDEAAIIFYQQAGFMADFSDDFAGNAPFSQYCPSYQMMGYEQLRTYFTWRTRVRAGDVHDTSPSYAFLYIYELLANVGVEDPRDGIGQLMAFWAAFREYHEPMDKHVLRWLKDYHIYYDLPWTFVDFVRGHGLDGYFPGALADSFTLFSSCSKYDIRKSAFHTVETAAMTAACFAHVLDRIRAAFTAVGMDFDDVLFRPTRKLVPWKPFGNALFHDHAKRADRRIVMGPDEYYMCHNNVWISSTNIVADKGRRFLGFVMKQMESLLRELTGYRNKLGVGHDMMHEDTIRILTKAGIHIERIVPAAVTEYYREATKTVVTVDPAALDRIRVEAQATQEALIVDEGPGLLRPDPCLANGQIQNDGVFAAAFADDAITGGPASVADIWHGFRNSLTDYELGMLAVILRGGDLKQYADECQVMVEVLVDSVNEKAIDHVGDHLIAEELALYDDYRVNVEEMIT